MKNALVEEVWIQIDKFFKAIVKIFDRGGEFVVGGVIFQTKVPTSVGSGFKSGLPMIGSPRLAKLGSLNPLP